MTSRNLYHTYKRQKQRADKPEYHSTVTIETVWNSRFRGDVVKLFVWTEKLQCTLHMPPQILLLLLLLWQHPLWWFIQQKLPHINNWNTRNNSNANKVLLIIKNNTNDNIYSAVIMAQPSWVRPVHLMINAAYSNRWPITFGELNSLSHRSAYCLYR